MLRRMTSCGALSAAAPALPRPLVLLRPTVAPATTLAGAEDRRQDRLCLRPRQLLAQLCQMTAGDMPGLMGEQSDLIWFGVVKSINAPELTKMRRPSTTKALKLASLMMTTCTFCCARSAARRIG